MKKVVVLVAFLFGFTAIVNAQEVDKKQGQTKSMKNGANTPEMRAQKSVDQLNKEVTLTEEQKVKIKELALTRVTKVDEIRAKYKGQPENKEVAKKEIETVRKDYRDNAKLTLTPEQLEKLKTKHKEMKAKGKENSLDAND